MMLKFQKVTETKGNLVTKRTIPLIGVIIVTVLPIFKLKYCITYILQRIIGFLRLVCPLKNTYI